MSASYDHILAFVLEHPWAITDSMRGMIAAVLARRIAGRDADPATIAAAVAQRKPLPQPKRGGAVAVIPLYGVIAPRVNMLSDMSGGTTFEGLTAQLRDAVATEAIKTIVFDVDSPGGSVAGATEFADEVRKARAIKPVIAQIEHLGASAAYWAMSGATKIYASPSAHVGSIGVVMLHEDISAALEKEGVKREVLTAGKFKGEGMDGGPLSDDARAALKELIASHYDHFIADVAKGRSVSASLIRKGYGEGRVVSAEQALAAGMIDRISTLSDTLASVTTAAPAGARALSDLSIAATDQEPPATSQERHLDAQFIAHQFALLALDVDTL